MKTWQAAVIVTAIIATIIAITYLVFKKQLMQLWAFIIGANYSAIATDQYEYGTKVPFTGTVATSTPTDAMITGQYYGLEQYQSVGLPQSVAMSSSYSDIQHGTVPALKQAIESIQGVKLEYMDISWNEATDNNIRDFRIAIIVSTDSSVSGTPQDILDKVTNLSWFSGFYSLLSFSNIQVYKWPQLIMQPM